MSSKIFEQLQDFLCHPEVIVLYSNIHKLPQSKLEEALRIRSLTLIGDKSILRMRLLRFEVQFFHPDIYIPYQLDNRLSKEDVATLQMRVDALCDMTKTLCIESTDMLTTLPKDLPTIQSTQETMTPTDATITKEVMSYNNAETQMKYRLNSVKMLKVCKLQYSGAKGLPAQNFLENLKEVRQFSKINEAVLLEILPLVLDLPTKEWFRANNFIDWQSFEKKFMEDHVQVNIAPVGNNCTRQVVETTSNQAPKLIKVTYQQSGASVPKTLGELKYALHGIGLRDCDPVSSSEKYSTASKPQSNVVQAQIIGHPFNIDNAKVLPDLVKTSALVLPFACVAQTPINCQPKVVTSNNIVNNVILTNSILPSNVVTVRPQTGITHVNTLPINVVATTYQPINHNMVTSSSHSLINPTNRITQPLGAAISNAPAASYYAIPSNFSQEYVTSQALNFGYTPYRYPTRYIIPNSVASINN